MVKKYLTKKERHPNYDTWAWAKRHRKVWPEEWIDFDTFVEEAGIKPSKDHKLRPKDESKPFGRDNFHWTLPKISDSDPEVREKRNQYYREYRHQNKDRLRSQELVKRYGITLEEYNTMLEKQDYSCAICGNPESNKINGKDIRLSIDHCHETNKVRGLLCSNCNRLLGLANDNPHVLQKASEYLS